MKSPKISVVIPSLNKGNRIEETLNSIFNQNYSDLEVIIIDGGSTDGTIRIVKKFAKKYPKQIFWLSQKDSGQLDAVKKGMDKAGGDIVTFINADDVYLKNTFNLVSSHFVKTPNALWFAGKSKVINGNGKEIASLVTLYKNVMLSLNSYTLLLIVNYFMQPSVFFTKNAYKKYGPFTGTDKFIMEYDMWLKIGKDRMPFVINSQLSKFRIESTTKTKTMFKEILNEDSKIAKKYTKNQFILVLHYLHNFGRMLIGSFI